MHAVAVRIENQTPARKGFHRTHTMFPFFFWFSAPSFPRILPPPTLIVSFFPRCSPGLVAKTKCRQNKGENAGKANNRAKGKGCESLPFGILVSVCLLCIIKGELKGSRKKQTNNEKGCGEGNPATSNRGIMEQRAIWFCVWFGLFCFHLSIRLHFFAACVCRFPDRFRITAFLVCFASSFFLFWWEACRSCNQNLNPFLYRVSYFFPRSAYPLVLSHFYAF